MTVKLRCTDVQCKLSSFTYIFKHTQTIYSANNSRQLYISWINKWEAAFSKPISCLMDAMEIRFGSIPRRQRRFVFSFYPENTCAIFDRVSNLHGNTSKSFHFLCKEMNLKKDFVKKAFTLLWRIRISTIQNFTCLPSLCFHKQIPDIAFQPKKKFIIRYKVLIKLLLPHVWSLSPRFAPKNSLMVKLALLLCPSFLINTCPSNKNAQFCFVISKIYEPVLWLRKLS